MMANSRSSENITEPTTTDDTAPDSTVTRTLTPSTSPALLRRDRYDLIYTESDASRNRNCKKFNHQPKKIREHYQTLEFYRKWTSHFISLLSGIPIRNAVSTSAPILDNSSTVTSNANPTLTDIEVSPRADYANELAVLTRRVSLLNQWEIDVAKAEMEALASILLNRPLYSSSSAKPDILLYRVHNSRSSKSPYSRDMGIRCSGWQKSLIIDQPSERHINGRAFQDHCNDEPVPSPYISVHTSVARLIRYITCRNLHQSPENGFFTIFVISLNKLKQLGIKATCTDDILASYEGNYRKNPLGRLYSNGVSYVTDSHWLVEGWIPDQTIVSEMGMQRFLEIAKDGGIDSEVIEKMGRLDKYSPLVAKKIGLEKWPARRSEGTNGEGNEKILRSGSETVVGFGSGIEAQGAGSSISRSVSDASSEDIENRLLRLRL